MKNILFSLICLFVISISSFSQVERYQALYLYQFTKNVSWDDVNDLNIVFFNSDAVYDIMSNTKNLKFHNSPIRLYKTGDPLNLSVEPNIIVMGRCSVSKIARIAAFYANKPVLIVSTEPRTLQYGAMIEFIDLDNRLKYKISEQNFKLHNMRASKKLLQLSL